MHNKAIGFDRYRKKVNQINLGEAKSKAIALINEKSNKGALIPYIKNADYLLRMPDAAQAAQTEIATVKKIHAVHNISQNPITPQGGLFSGFDEIQFLGNDLVDTQGTGSRSYYFEVDKPCTVYIEEEVDRVWVTLNTINVTDINAFTAYKGLITPSDASNTVRLRFTGMYPFNVRNRALWAYTFASVGDIPDYRPYVKYQLPSNAMEIKKIIHETDVRQYGSLSDYYVEGKTTVVLNYFFFGSLRVEFYQYPTRITPDTPDTFEFELDYEAQELIPYYIAASVLMDDKESRPFGVIRLNEYQAKLANLSTDDNSSFHEIANLSNW